MKLTKSTLKRLIREEHQKLLEEGFMDIFKRYPGFEDAEGAGIDPKLAKEDFSEDEWALLAWDRYAVDGFQRRGELLRSWRNWTERAKKVRLEPDIWRMFVEEGWAVARGSERSPGILRDARSIYLTDEGREKFIDLVDRAIHLKTMETNPEYRAKYRAKMEKAAGGLSIADDGAEGALSLT
jgi:hypothetical protein